MRITIPLVVLVAILVGPSAFAQSPSQDNTGQIPNNSGAGVPGLPGNKSGPAHRPDGMTVRLQMVWDNLSCLGTEALARLG